MKEVGESLKDRTNVGQEKANIKMIGIADWKKVARNDKLISQVSKVQFK